jgi:hypothetical protein
MALHRNAVGPNLYVWSGRKGGPSKTQAVISSHGGTSIINGMNYAPECTLIFYAPHGRPLNDPSVKAILAQTVQQYESMSSRASQNYELSKYDDRPSEDYERIGQFDDEFRRYANQHTETAQLLGSLPNKSPMQEFQLRQQQVNAKLFESMPMDIITVRNRTGLRSGYTVTLAYALAELWAYGYKYEDIHCCFCRGDGADYRAPPIELLNELAALERQVLNPGQDI